MVEFLAIKYSIATKKDLAIASVPRSLYSSKRENGSITIVGGSERFHGAPVLASTAAYSVIAALRIGIGYATEFVPRSILKETRSLSPDIIVRSFKDKNLGPRDIPTLSRKIDRSECMVIGPGIGSRPETHKAVIGIIEYVKRKGKRAVIDADAISALSSYKKQLNKNFIITPNKKEFNILFSKKIDEKNISSRVNAAVEVSKKLNAVVIFKGHNTVVTDGKRSKLIKAKSSALGVMGTGDVLAGMVGAYAAVNSDMFVAGVAGAYLQTTIGDILHKKMGNHILASDVVNYIPRVLKKFDRNKR